MQGEWITLIYIIGTSIKDWVILVCEHSNKNTSGHIPDVQCALKVFVILKALQFALRIAFCCVHHRCRILDIHCWKLYRLCRVHHIKWQSLYIRLWYKFSIHVWNTHGVSFVRTGILRQWYCPPQVTFRGFMNKHFPYINKLYKGRLSNFFRVLIVLFGVIMILPQVHLRKPCYDLSFL